VRSEADQDACFERLKDRFTGSALGTFVGDAMGRPVEGWTAQMIQTVYGVLGEMEEGIYTDDTEMMIGIMESLVEQPRFDPVLTAGKFLGNFNPYRGYGGRIFGVMDRLRCGVVWNKAGTDSWGNGGAMRVAPIGFFYYDNTTDLIKAARDCSFITHQHPLGLAGAVAQATAVGLATWKGLRGEGIDHGEFVDRMTESVAPISREMADMLARVKTIQRGRDLRETIAGIASRFACDVSALGAVPPALASFLMTEDFPEAVVVAVNCGGDTDTIGAMTGALAGAYYGYGAIPERWMDRLENGPRGKRYVMSLAERLAHIKWGQTLGPGPCRDRSDDD
jgi:poly(ADP-ribose) glycohydrolase ARH3